MTVVTAFSARRSSSLHLDRRSSSLHQPLSELSLPAAHDALRGQHKGARCLLGREQPRQESCYLLEVDIMRGTTSRHASTLNRHVGWIGLNSTPLRFGRQ